MKHFKLFVLAIAALLVGTSGTYSQWQFCPGSSSVTGIGSNPGVYCLDANNAIVVGGSTGAPRVYRTTDGGATFTNVTGNITGPELYAGCMVDATTFLVGDGAGNATMWRTSNAGVNWSVVVTTGGTGGFFNGIVKASLGGNFIIAQSDAPTGGTGGTQIMYVSTNGGLNWTAQNETGLGFGIGSLPAVYCIDNQFYGHGSSTASPSRVGYTTNGGTTWQSTTLTNLTGSTFLSGVAFNDNKLNGLAISSTNFPNIQRTTNGPGGPWTTVSAGAGASTLNVLRWAPGTNMCFLGTTNVTGAIRVTTDNGATWINQTTGGLTGFFDISVQNNGGTINAYAIALDGANGVVMKIQTLVGIDPSNTSTPTTFSLEQNYPNPFNPATTIKYAVPTAGNVSVKIYNTLGVEVMTVVNKHHTTGNYVENVDMSGFTSGVYFYTISADGFKETKKMMLVK